MQSILAKIVRVWIFRIYSKSFPFRADPFPEEGGVQQKGNIKVQGVPQSQTAALPRHQEEEETDKSKQAQIEQTYKKH